MMLLYASVPDLAEFQRHLRCSQYLQPPAQGLEYAIGSNRGSQSLVVGSDLVMVPCINAQNRTLAFEGRRRPGCLDQAPWPRNYGSTGNEQGCISCSCSLGSSRVRPQQEGLNTSFDPIRPNRQGIDSKSPHKADGNWFIFVLWNRHVTSQTAGRRKMTKDRDDGGINTLFALL